jgi:hypothetical protein
MHVELFQLQLAVVEQVELAEEIMVQMAILQFFQQLHQQVVVEVQRVMALLQEILGDQVEEVQEIHQKVEQVIHLQQVLHKEIQEEQEIQ